MSMPSDLNSDTSDSLGRHGSGHASQRSRSLLRQVTPEQLGVAAATLVAFIGVSVVGPRIAALRRPPTLGERARVSAHDARRRAEAAGGRAQKRLRRLGGGTIRR